MWRPVSKYHQLQFRQPLHLLSASRVPICCGHLDVPCDYSQGSTASGQLREASHVVGDVAVKPCICSLPPLNISTTLSRSSLSQLCYNTKGQPSKLRNRQLLLPSSVSWSRDRHPRCDAATGSYVPEGEKHDRDPTDAIHDGSPLAPLRDGRVDFPAAQKPKRP